MSKVLPKEMLCSYENLSSAVTAGGIEIELENNTTETIYTLLYQSDIDVPTCNYLTGAWKQDKIAPGGTGRAYIPIEVSVAGSDKFGELSTMTKKITSGNGKKFELFENQKPWTSVTQASFLLMAQLM